MPVAIIRTLVTALAFITAAAAAAANTTAPAAGTAAVVAPAYQFAIAAGELHVVITQFSTVTGRPVLLPPGASLEGLPSPGVVGRFTADEALIRALEGTGITFRKADAVTYALEVAVDSQLVEVTARAPYSDTVTASATKLAQNHNDCQLAKPSLKPM